MQPVAGPVDAGDGGVAEGARAAVLGRVPELALLSANLRIQARKSPDFLAE